MRAVVALALASLIVAAFELPPSHVARADSTVHAAAIELAMPTPPLRAAVYAPPVAVRPGAPAVRSATVDRAPEIPPRADGLPRWRRWWTRLRSASSGSSGH